MEEWALSSKTPYRAFGTLTRESCPFPSNTNENSVERRLHPRPFLSDEKEPNHSLSAGFLDASFLVSRPKRQKRETNHLRGHHYSVNGEDFLETKRPFLGPFRFHHSGLRRTGDSIGPESSKIGFLNLFRKEWDPAALHRRAGCGVHPGRARRLPSGFRARAFVLVRGRVRQLPDSTKGIRSRSIFIPRGAPSLRGMGIYPRKLPPPRRKYFALAWPLAPRPPSRRDLMPRFWSARFISRKFAPGTFYPHDHRGIRPFAFVYRRSANSIHKSGNNSSVLPD